MVAPLVGAWIEIALVNYRIPIVEVAPLVGAWIEIMKLPFGFRCRPSRTPRGCVD